MNKKNVFSFMPMSPNSVVNNELVVPLLIIEQKDLPMFISYIKSSQYRFNSEGKVSC